MNELQETKNQENGIKCIKKKGYTIFIFQELSEKVVAKWIIWRVGSAKIYVLELIFANKNIFKKIKWSKHKMIMSLGIDWMLKSERERHGLKRRRFQEKKENSLKFDFKMCQ